MKHKASSTTAVAGSAGKLMATVEGEGGLPILFVHDFAADHTHWAEAQHGLDTRTVAFDLRGYGASGGGHGPFGVGNAVDDVLAVADALIVGRFVLVGHGFGGAVASAFAAYYPDRLAGLLYVDPPGDVRQTPREDWERWLENFTQEKYGGFQEHWFAPLLADAKPATRTMVTKTLRTSRREASAGNMASLFEHDPGEAFTSFTGPTHALVATTGPETLVGQRPELSRSVAPRTSHWLMLDAPQWFHSELVKFRGDCAHPR